MRPAALDTAGFVLARVATVVARTSQLGRGDFLGIAIDDRMIDKFLNWALIVCHGDRTSFMKLVLKEPLLLYQKIRPQSIFPCLTTTRPNLLFRETFTGCLSRLGQQLFEVAFGLAPELHDLLS